eukprot:CAMPEP_0179103044 /NCGR_PEP_ID=MMETSP0796-20121207/47723_1 /TAXON_ID=73915 /ORGANISM="Pyrodinium bahamense, Strain pbaha01" /LENGTH=157 /DNA_ID=CAMNT_0020800935 /DNA_START=84 /DNA_END=557 /DNA_ORIENTATION=-
MSTQEGTILIGELRFDKDLYHDKVKKRLKVTCKSWLKRNNVGNPDFKLYLSGAILCSEAEANDFKDTGIKWTEDSSLWDGPDPPDGLDPSETPYNQIKGRILDALHWQSLAQVIKVMYPGYEQEESELSESLEKSSSVHQEAVKEIADDEDDDDDED